MFKKLLWVRLTQTVIKWSVPKQFDFIKSSLMSYPSALCGLSSVDVLLSNFSEIKPTPALSSQISSFQMVLLARIPVRGAWTNANASELLQHRYRNSTTVWLPRKQLTLEKSEDENHMRRLWSVCVESSLYNTLTSSFNGHSVEEERRWALGGVVRSRFAY